jgi:hypothetical protein
MMGTVGAIGSYDLGFRLVKLFHNSLNKFI